MNRIIFISIGFAALAAAGAVAIVASPPAAGVCPRDRGRVGLLQGVAPTAVAGTRCGSLRCRSTVRTRARNDEIVFALVPRRDVSRPSLGTLVLSSGPILAAAGEYTAGLDPVRSRRDVLFVDQRGTGRSGVLACPVLRGVVPALCPSGRWWRGSACAAASSGRGPGSTAPPPQPTTSRPCGPRSAWSGSISGVSSYGTYLMTVYAARHPAHVQSLVLHGAYPIDFDPWALDRLAAARRSIGLVCARSGDCRGDVVLRNLAELATRLRAHPVTFTVPVGGAHDRAPRRGSPRRLAYGAGNVAGFGRLPAADGQRARRRPRAPAPPGRADAAADRRRLRTGIRPAVPRVPTRLLLRRLAGRPPRHLSARSRRDRVARTGAVLRRSVDGDATGSRRLVPGMAERPRGRPPVRARHAFAGRPRPRPLRRSRHEHPGTSGRLAARQFPNALFVEIPNVGHTPETSPCGVALALRFVDHARGERAGVCRNGHASARRPPRAPRRGRVAAPRRRRNRRHAPGDRGRRRHRRRSRRPGREHRALERCQRSTRRPLRHLGTRRRPARRSPCRPRRRPSPASSRRPKRAAPRARSG